VKNDELQNCTRTYDFEAEIKTRFSGIPPKTIYDTTGYDTKYLQCTKKG